MGGLAVAESRVERDPGDDPGETISRNFHIPVEMAEWLRVTAFMRRTSQTQLVREALARLRNELEGGGPPR